MGCNSHLPRSCNNTQVQVSPFQVEPAALHPEASEDVINDYATKNTKFFLSYYIQARINEKTIFNAQYNGFWASVFSSGRDADSKIAAAEKCLRLLNGEEDISFSQKELAACKNGRLESLIKDDPALKVQLEGRQSHVNRPSAIGSVF